MFNIQDLANFLQEKLNSIGTPDKYSFNICAEVGESSKEALINGIVKTIKNDTPTIKDYVDYDYVGTCALLVPTARANKLLIGCEKIVNELVNSFNGTKINIGDGQATIHISLGKPDNFSVAYTVGDCTPLYFTCSLLYVEDTLMSIDKQWFLNNERIPYFSEEVMLNKDGILRKVDYDAYTRTLLTGQTRYYKFEIPCQNSVLCNMLQRDMLDGDFDKQYTLTYIDGINYTEESPFETTVSIYSTGNNSSQPMKASRMSIMFTDVDNGQTTTKYYIGMIDWMFDLGSEDTRWFSDMLEQQVYFERKVTNSTGWQQIKAPNLNSIFITSQVFPNETNMEIFDLARKNYAIIKVLEGTLDNPTNVRYFYYGATNCQIGANGLVTYDLEEDTIQTILFNPDLRIADSFVERCHLDRFVVTDYTPEDDPLYSFNFKQNSLLFEREPIQSCPLRPTEKRKLKVVYDKGGSNGLNIFDTWFNDNVSHWVYYFMSANVDYKQTDGSHSEDFRFHELHYQTRGWGFGIAGGFVVFCVPVYKTQHVIKNLDGDILGSHVEAFLANNNGYANVFAIKNSIVPPFMFNSLNASQNYEIDDLGNMVLHCNTWYGNEIDDTWGGFFFKVYSPTDERSIFYVQIQDITTPITLYSELQFYEDTFTRQEIRNWTNEGDPKLYNEDYSTYHIYFGGQTYDMPVSKTSNLPAFAYYEPLTPDITKFYLTFDVNSSYGENKYPSENVYNENTEKDYTGFVGCLDTSMWFSKEKLDEWLAQNKNNLQIFQNNQELARKNANISAGMGVVGSLVGGIVGAGASPTPAGVVGALTGAVTGIAMSGLKRKQTEWNLENEAINRGLTIDNMRQSPASLSALNSNIVLIQGVDEFGLYIEFQEMLPEQQNVVIDYLKRYGYSVNKIGDIMSYISTSNRNLKRDKYVYIKGELGALYGLPISTQERLNLKDRFSAGIRFWNADKIDYSEPNFEYGI